MKRTLSLVFTAALFFMACNTQTQSATGEIDYFVGEAPTGVHNSALGQLCFTPAQLETTNGGEMFCFTNTDEALTMLGVDKSKTCADYWYGFASVEFENLTTAAGNHTKANTCFEAGTCDFNTATLIKATETSSGLKCKTGVTTPATTTYTDPSGFSFEYPTDWALQEETDVPTLLNTEGDRISFTLVSGDKVQDIDNKFGDATYQFDETLNTWQVTWNTDATVGTDQGPKAAELLFNTNSGFPVFAGVHRWKTDVVALSHTQFLLVNITGSGETTALDPIVKSIEYTTK